MPSTDHIRMAHFEPSLTGVDRSQAHDARPGVWVNQPQRGAGQARRQAREAAERGDPKAHGAQAAEREPGQGLRAAQHAAVQEADVRGRQRRGRHLQRGRAQQRARRARQRHLRAEIRELMLT